MPLGDDLDGAVGHLDGRLVVDGVRRTRDAGGPSLRLGHGVLGHELVTQVREDREVDDPQGLVAPAGRPPAERMKAVGFSRFGGPEVLEIVDLPDPHPGPGQVRIAVRAAGVNPSDWKKRAGLIGGELPQTVGHEAAGVVDELGEGAADVAVGDRVFGLSAEGAAQAEVAVLSYYIVG